MSLVRSVHNYRMYGLTEMYQACRHASIYDIVSCHLCDILILMANHLSQLILVVILIYRCHLNQTAQGSEKPRDLLMAEPYDKSSCDQLVKSVGVIITYSDLDRLRPSLYLIYIKKGKWKQNWYAFLRGGNVKGEQPGPQDPAYPCD